MSVLPAHKVHARDNRKAFRLNARNVAVPDFVCVFGQIDPLELLLAFIVKKAQFHLRRVCGKQREVHSLSIPPGASRERISLSNFYFSAFFVNCGLAAVIAPIVHSIQSGKVCSTSDAIGQV